MKASPRRRYSLAMSAFVLAAGVCIAPLAGAWQTTDSKSAAPASPSTDTPASPPPMAASQPAGSPTVGTQSSPPAASDAAAAASPAQAGTAAPSTGAPADGNGRIVFYRISALFGYGMRADIVLDGNKVGRTTPGTQFHVDTTPGVHHIGVPNEVYSGARGLDVPVVAGQTSYVRFWIGGSGFGGRTNMEIVDPSKGASDTANLKTVTN